MQCQSGSAAAQKFLDAGSSLSKPELEQLYPFNANLVCLCLISLSAKNKMYPAARLQHDVILLLQFSSGFCD